MELNNFLKRYAWQFVLRAEIKMSGRKLVPAQLVFKKKDEIDGLIQFKTRCVILGVVIVPGVDFTERFSPVATDEYLKCKFEQIYVVTTKVGKHIDVTSKLRFWNQPWMMIF